MAGDPRQAALAGCTRYAPIVRAAKALVCVLLKKDELYNPMKDHQGAGACIQNMLLAAESLGIGSCCRASLALYNTEEDVDALLNNLENVRKVMGL